MNKKQFSFQDRFLSFRFAFRGIRTLISDEHNAWIHSFIAVAVLICGFCFGLSYYEWIAVSFAIGFVFALEAVNSAIELLCDFVSPERHDVIGRVKDLAAGAVLFAAFTAVVIGVLVFFPKIIAIF
ncbi:MAG: diacylglycerol kinase family protein [Massilibacteroides sp.]|nr:diacylglycerol kinase family protein [Massilibacteroides sp.]MDD4114575.1 diacylglycerol kinase family protein [Massilibacteroides sp.]MDD4660774.1 diacylglycerol kinase family protein [Massilibacteroides sp.]